MNSVFPTGLGGSFTFAQRSTAIAPELRPLYRVSILTFMILKCGRSGSCSLLKLHVLNWWLRNPEARRQSTVVLETQSSVNHADIRFEPSFVRAIDFAAAEGLVEFRQGKNVTLTDKGRVLATKIEEDALFPKDRAFLTLVGKRLTESKLRGHRQGATLF